MTGWLDETFDILGIREAHIVGHSMGAKIALGFALAHPQRVGGLALISPAGLGAEFHHGTLDAFLSNPAHGEALARDLLGPRGVHLIPAVARSLSDAASDFAKSEALKKLLGQARAYGLALSPEGFDWSKIRVPLTILWGDHDRLIPMPEVAPPAAARAGADHCRRGPFAAYEASGDVVSALKEFLP